ncbi:MAG: hypothetical protein KAX28_06695 [Candidatus Marinimicrobia bacterium]|nr:hypothetical protein [Candidatus Neomarinimicrobiota bacterium]
MALGDRIEKDLINIVGIGIFLICVAGFILKLFVTELLPAGISWVVYIVGMAVGLVLMGRHKLANALIQLIGKIKGK